MVRKIAAIGVVIALAGILAVPAKAQEASKKEVPKAQMKAAMTEMGPVKEIACDPACGFVVRSRNEKELVSIAREHLKTVHHMKMSEKEMKEKVKAVDVK